MVTLKVIFRGRVQGVGFRATIYRHALQLSTSKSLEYEGVRPKTQVINGYVRNLATGEVELVAVGERDVLENLLSAITASPGAATIENISKVYTNAGDRYKDFSVR